MNFLTNVAVKRSMHAEISIFLLFAEHFRVTVMPTDKLNCYCRDHGNAIVPNQHVLNYFNFMTRSLLLVMTVMCFATG